MADLSTQPESLLSVFRSLPSAYIVLSSELIIEEASDAYLEATLAKRGNLLGRYVFEAFPDNPQAPEAHAVRNWKASLEQVLATGKPHQMAVQHYDVPDPENPGKFVERHWLPANFPVFDQQGQLRHIIHSTVNVTENVIAEKQLHESKAREQQAQQQTQQQRRQLERLFMQAPAAICVLSGSDLVYELVNSGYQQLFPTRELLGKPILAAIPEIVNNEFYRTFQEVYRTGKTHEEQELLIPLNRPDGVLEDRYFKYIQQARYDWQGNIDGVVVFAFEVTELVKARQRIETNAHQLQLLTDALPVLIGYLDKEEKYLFANQAYQAWFNQKPEELLGRSVQEVIGAKAYQNVKSYIDRVLTGERLDFEATMPYRDDFVKHIRVSYIPDVRSNEIKGFYTLVSDVTQQVEARQALQESERQAHGLAADLAQANENLTVVNQQLRYINVDLDNFIYTASHDLKAPILNIEGLVEALLVQLPTECLHSDSVQPITDLILASVQRFKRTINHLTEITKLQKEGIPVASTVDLIQIIADVQSDLTLLIQAAQAQIEINVADCPAIRFSEKNLRSIIYNLLSNAIKYRSPDRTPVVEVYCQVTDEYQVLSVRDNGLGMDLTKEHKLFGMFKRLHNHVEGSGIGLYMVKKIIENAGGKIEVQSKLGTGSIFKVYFRINP